MIFDDDDRFLLNIKRPQELIKLGPAVNNSNINDTPSVWHYKPTSTAMFWFADLKYMLGPGFDSSKDDVHEGFGKGLSILVGFAGAVYADRASFALITDGQNYMYWKKQWYETNLSMGHQRCDLYISKTPNAEKCKLILNDIERACHRVTYYSGARYHYWQIYRKILKLD
jgi:hypothetical protein